MYEFMELEELAQSAKQLSQMFTFIWAGMTGEERPIKEACDGTLFLYNDMMKSFAASLQDYFSRAYADWKEKRE